METLWFQQALLPSGWAARVRLSMAGGRITAIEPGVDPAPTDRRFGTALPGLANVHSHCFQRLMAGLAESRGAGASDDFWSWRDLMYRLVAAIGPDDLHAIAAMAFVEMLEGGFTRVGEFHYLHHQPSGAPFDDPAEMAASIAAAAAETGIALTLLPVFYAHGGFGAQSTSDAQRRFITSLDGYARLIDASRAAVATLDNAVVGIAPHSLRAVAPDELTALAALCPDGPIHLHIAEQEKEVADCLAWSGARPVEWLLDHAKVDERWCLVHATHVTQPEIERIARSGAVVGLCPITEANLGDGIFPAEAFVAAGGAFGIGSDSNVRIDAAEELRLLEYGQRLSLRRRNVLTAPGQSTGRTLFDAAQTGGARAVRGCQQGLSAGAPADLVALAATPFGLGDQALDRWVFAEQRVEAVWRAGRQCVVDGRHVARDRVAARFASVSARLPG